MKAPPLLLVLLLTALLFSACGPKTTPAPATTEAPTAEAPKTQAPATPPLPVATSDPNAVQRGGTVVFGTSQEPAVLNPLLASSSIEDAVSALAIEGLVEINADGQYEAVLAEALPTVSEDGLVVTYPLRQGIKFSNGQPFTCADVKFTLEAILSDLSGASTAGYSDIDSLECKDDYTAVVTFAELYAPYLRLFSYILPQSAGDLTQLDKWEFNRNPIGTGPFIVKEWKAGDSITFVKNPYYHEEGRPYLDSIVIKLIPSREVGLQLLGTGELDALWNLNESDFPTLDKMEGVSYAGVLAGSGENELLVLNFADPTMDAPADPAANPHPILSDLKVRQAIQMGIDKQLIADALLYGKVKVGTTVLPAGPFACPQEPSKYDPAGAQALLAEAGWTVGPDGIRQKDGVRLSLKLQTTSGNRLREDTERVLVDMMKQIGIELKMENVPSDVLFADWEDNGLRQHGNFDLLLYTTGAGIDPDSHLFGNYHSARIPTADNEGAGSNYSRYINADVDQWIDGAASTADMNRRHELYCRVAAQINQDLPRIFLYERLLLSGYRTHLQNFVLSPGPEDFATHAANWWIKK